MITKVSQNYSKTTSTITASSYPTTLPQHPHRAHNDHKSIPKLFQNDLQLSHNSPTASPQLAHTPTERSSRAQRVSGAIRDDPRAVAQLPHDSLTTF